MDQDRQHEQGNTSGYNGTRVSDRINVCVMHQEKGSHIHTLDQQIREKQDIHMLGHGSHYESVVAKSDTH